MFVNFYGQTHKNPSSSSDSSGLPGWKIRHISRQILFIYFFYPLLVLCLYFHIWALSKALVKEVSLWSIVCKDTTGHVIQSHLDTLRWSFVNQNVQIVNVWEMCMLWLPWFLYVRNQTFLRWGKLPVSKHDFDFSFSVALSATDTYSCLSAENVCSPKRKS